MITGIVLFCIGLALLIIGRNVAMPAPAGTIMWVIGVILMIFGGAYFLIDVLAAQPVTVKERV